MRLRRLAEIDQIVSRLTADIKRDLGKCLLLEEDGQSFVVACGVVSSIAFAVHKKGQPAGVLSVHTSKLRAFSVSDRKKVTLAADKISLIHQSPEGEADIVHGCACG